jgi:hypothetical protein
MTAPSTTNRGRARTRSVACGEALGGPPRPPLGVCESLSQVSAPAPASPQPPLHSADHPATPWWSALFRGGSKAGAGAGEGLEEERRAGRVRA